MFIDTSFWIGGDPCIEGIIGTTKDVDSILFHRSTLSKCDRNANIYPSPDCIDYRVIILTIIDILVLKFINMSEVLDGITTVDDAEKKFWSVNLVDAVLMWYQGQFVVVRNDRLKRTWLEVMKGVPKKLESDSIPSLCEHICTQCDYALRTPHWKHHLFRYVPMRYFPIQNGWHRGEWDSTKELIHTLCMSDIDLPNTTKKLIPMYNEATLHRAPMKGCPKNTFLEKKKV